MEVNGRGREARRGRGQQGDGKRAAGQCSTQKLQGMGAMWSVATCHGLG